MAKHTRRKRARPVDNCSAARDAGKSEWRVQTTGRHVEHQSLAELAAAHGRQLRDVPADNSCQFHAILDALQHQLQPPRAVTHDVHSLRRAIVATLEDESLLERLWVASSDSDTAPAELGRLRRTLEIGAKQSDCTLNRWYEKMRLISEWGDGNTLIGAALLQRVRIHVVSKIYSSGSCTIEVPACFGDDYAPTADIWIARDAERQHYLSAPADPLLQPIVQIDECLPQEPPPASPPPSPSPASPSPSASCGLRLG